MIAKNNLVQYSYSNFYIYRKKLVNGALIYQIFLAFLFIIVNFFEGFVSIYLLFLKLKITLIS